MTRSKLLLLPSASTAQGFRNLVWIAQCSWDCTLITLGWWPMMCWFKISSGGYSWCKTSITTSYPFITSKIWCSRKPRTFFNDFFLLFLSNMPFLAIVAVYTEIYLFFLFDMVLLTLVAYTNFPSSSLSSSSNIMHLLIWSSIMVVAYLESSI